jgi:hypothetical protein
MKLSQMLTIVVVAGAVLALGGVILGQVLQNTPNYGSQLRYSLKRIQLRYDYSCDENVYGLYLVLNNTGPETVSGLSIAMTNELCVGAIPSIPNTLASQGSLKLYLYSTASNGTIMISGNNTQLIIAF